MIAAIFGLSGPYLTVDERTFLRGVEPTGYILFARNIVDHAQVAALTCELRALHGRDTLPILIDQEGGRVARLPATKFPLFPAAGRFERLYDLAPASAIAAVRLNAQALGLVLNGMGITVNCAPVLDLRHPGAHDIVGDRAFGDEPLRVAALGRAMIEGLADAGVVGVVKHIPGHGRALCDSHHAMPRIGASRVDLAQDFQPFQRLADAPMAMTAHVLYEAIDPDHPATQSCVVIEQVIRGAIGFDGLLLSDDLDMAALTGSVPERAERAVAAGCDVALNCWGRLDDMAGIATRVGALSVRGHERLARAMGVCNPAPDLPAYAELVAQRDALLALAE